MAVRFQVVVTLVCAAGGLGGCALAAVDLHGKRCPCGDGWVCDEAANVCVETSAAGDAGFDAAAPRDASSAPDAVPAPDGGRDAAPDASGRDAAPDASGRDAGPCGFTTNVVDGATITTPFVWTWDPCVPAVKGYFWADGNLLHTSASSPPYTWTLPAGTLTTGAHELGHSWDLADGTHLAPPSGYSVTIQNP